jgi:hypothetical protein
MSMIESEYCFSTLRLAVAHLKNAVRHDRLNAVAMISIHKDIISEIPQFS